jgi:hypothetical protein
VNVRFWHKAALKLLKIGAIVKELHEGSHAASNTDFFNAIGAKRTF